MTATFQAVTGGTTAIGTSISDRVGGNGLVLGGIGGGNAVSGNLVFTDLDIFATGTGIAVVGSGTLTAGTGFGLTTQAGSSVDASGVADGVVVANSNLNLNNTAVETNTGATVNATASTLSGSGNTATTFSCTDGGGNTGSILFNAGADSCP